MIRIDNDGTVRFLHDDKLTATFKDEGDLSMKRATDIRFHNNDKLWYVHLPGEDTKVLEVGFADRASALRAEVEILNRLL